jgi:PhnB protein
MVHELFAYLCVSSSAKAIDFYGAAFGATEKFRLTEPSGRIGHAELDLNGMTLMLCDESVTLHLHVDNADAMVQRALDAGATLEMAVADAFYGERGGVVRDPFGHRWLIGHSIEDVKPQEMQRRYTAMMQTSA